MISGAPSQDPLLSDNGEAVRLSTITRTVNTGTECSAAAVTGREQSDPGGPGLHKINEMVTLVS